MQVLYLQNVYFGTRDGVRPRRRKRAVGVQIHVRKIAKIFIAERPFTFWRRRITRSILRRYFIFLVCSRQSRLPPPSLLAFGWNIARCRALFGYENSDGGRESRSLVTSLRDELVLDERSTILLRTVETRQPTNREEVIVSGKDNAVASSLTTALLRVNSN